MSHVLENDRRVELPVGDRRDLGLAIDIADLQMVVVDVDAFRPHLHREGFTVLRKVPNEEVVRCGLVEAAGEVDLGFLLDQVVLHDKVRQRNIRNVLAILKVQRDSVLVEHPLNLQLLLLTINEEVTHPKIIIALLGRNHPLVLFADDQPANQVLMDSDEDTIVIGLSDPFTLCELVRCVSHTFHLVELLELATEFLEFVQPQD